jgi:two-component system sensor histidine kinase RegB
MPVGKNQPFFSPSRIAEPQAAFLLLGVLRLFTIGSLVLFCSIVEKAQIHSLMHLLYWPVIAVCAGAGLLCSIATYIFRERPVSQLQMGIVLVFDIALWYGLVAASGGAINPAISYLLVLLAIAALTLKLQFSVMLALLTVLLYAVMMGMQPEVHHGHMLNWHLWGMWVLFLMNAVIMLLVITLLMRAIRERDKAIAVFREDTVRNEQLVAMGTLAANIAHELGTPLSTIAVLAGEMDHPDAIGIREQLERCRNTLGQLKSLPSGSAGEKVLFSKKMLEKLVEEIHLLKPSAAIDWEDHVGKNLAVSPLLEQSLRALVNNAVEAAGKRVFIRFFPEGESLVLDIHHDGEVLSEELLNTLGQQRVSSRKNSLGIGYYLANASIERLGGSLQIHNEQCGVVTRVLFPQTRLLAP